MAAGRRLVLVFGTEDGDVTHSYSYVDSTIQEATVNTLMDTIITNGSIFTKVPLSKKSAKLVTTTEAIYVLDNN